MIRVDKPTLLKNISIWDRYLKKKVHIIACGGTALTLLNLKESTKDIDLLLPIPGEYKYLVKILAMRGQQEQDGTGIQALYSIYLSARLYLQPN